MICVSLAERNFEKCIKLLHDCKLAEIRLDKTRFSQDQIREIFSLPVRMIATFRPGEAPDEERRNHLIAAIQSGAEYVDIELEAPREYKEKVIQAARENDCRIIVSFHDFHQTPDRETLLEIIEQCFASGADIAKIACFARSKADCARICSIYDSGYAASGRVIAIGMGKRGIVTRIAAPLLGAPFTFVSPYRGGDTGEGQLDKDRLIAIMEKMNGE